MAKMLRVCLFGFLLVHCFSPSREVDGTMVGGISQVDMSDKAVKSDILKGLHSYLMMENKGDLKYKHICGTLRASVQVVQGVLYRVAVEIVPVVDDVSSSGCIQKDKFPVLMRGKEKLGCFTVWSRPWLEDEESGFIVKKMEVNDYKSCLQVNSQ